MKKKIDVTQWDIDNGEIDGPVSCPVALAAKRVIKNSVVVNGSTIVLIPKYRYRTTKIKLPEEVHQKIKKYDNGAGMKPFSFTIDIPFGYWLNSLFSI